MQEKSLRSFENKLASLLSGDQLPGDTVTLNNELFQAFLAFGSHTDDNLECVDHVEYGRVTGLRHRTGEVIGFKIKGKNRLLSQILNVLENLDLPDQVQSELPGLTNEEWHATLRVATMIFIAFERDVPTGMKGHQAEQSDSAKTSGRW